MDDDHRPRYSSWPAVSVREREYVVPSIVRVTEYESSIVGSYLVGSQNPPARRSHARAGGDVLVCPLTTHQAQCYGRLAAPSVSTNGNRYLVVVVHA